MNDVVRKHIYTAVDVARKDAVLAHGQILADTAILELSAAAARQPDGVDEFFDLDRYRPPRAFSLHLHIYPAVPFATHKPTAADFAAVQALRVLEKGGGAFEGYRVAPAFVSFFLSKTGPKVGLNVEEVMQKNTGLQVHLIETVYRELSKALARPDLGTPSFAASYAVRRHFGFSYFTASHEFDALLDIIPEADSDYYYALGSVYTRIGLAFDTVEVDGQLRLNCRFAITLYDLYDWHTGLSVDIKGQEVSDDNFVNLHSVGLARNFPIEGTSKDFALAFDIGPPEAIDLESNGSPYLIRLLREIGAAVTIGLRSG